MSYRGWTRLSLSPATYMTMRCEQSELMGNPSSMAENSAKHIKIIKIIGKTIKHQVKNHAQIDVMVGRLSAVRASRSFVGSWR